PVSDDKRADIIAAKQRNEPVAQIKKWFNISERTISRIWNKYQKTGTYQPTPCLGRKSKLSKETDQQIKDTIAETPDITLNELIDKLSLDLTEGGLSFHLKKLGLTFKKRSSMQVSKNELM
ncbi:MAG: helix-turn-helix domain-containing protein, partial [Candidatus Bathyarchaeota archaeon]|nr:helix-turn-helix domain-containing protein [Candidatus Termiticorpusculum sp.]